MQASIQSQVGGQLWFYFLSFFWEVNLGFLFISSFSDLPTQQHYREPLVATNVIVKEAFVSRKLSLVVKVEMGEYFGRDFRKPPKSQLLPQPRLLPHPPMTQGGWFTSPEHSTFVNFLRNLALDSKHVKVEGFNSLYIWSSHHVIYKLLHTWISHISECILATEKKNIFIKTPPDLILFLLFKFPNKQPASPSMMKPLSVS